MNIKLYFHLLTHKSFVFMDLLENMKSSYMEGNDSGSISLHEYKHRFHHLMCCHLCFRSAGRSSQHMQNLLASQQLFSCCFLDFVQSFFLLALEYGWQTGAPKIQCPQRKETNIL